MFRYLLIVLTVVCLVVVVYNHRFAIDTNAHIINYSDVVYGHHMYEPMIYDNGSSLEYVYHSDDHYYMSIEYWLLANNTRIDSVKAHNMSKHIEHSLAYVSSLVNE